MSKPPECVDCIKNSHPVWRPTPHGGPRSPLCVSCYRERKRVKSSRSHSRQIQNTFGLSEDEYWGLWRFQKELVAEMGGTGVDPIDLRSNGTKKRLAVDHCHECGEIRGLLAGSNNYGLLGRYDIDALKRAIDYLENPPARKYFGEPRYIPQEPDASEEEN